MKIKANRKSVLEAFRKASRALNPRSPIPALTGLKVEALPGGSVAVTGAGEGLFITACMQAEVLEPGAAVLPGETALGLVEKLPEGELFIEKTGAASTIRYGGSEAVLNNFPVEDFWSPPAASGGAVFTVSSSGLCSALGSVLPFAGEELHVWGSICVDFKGGNLTVAATDTYCLSVVWVPSGYVEEATESRILVPKKAAGELRRLFSGTESAPLTVSVSSTGSCASFSDGRTSLVASLFSGKFPDVEAFVKEEKGKVVARFAVNLSSLLGVLERAQAVADSALFSVSPGQVVVAAEGDAGRFRESFGAETSGREIGAAFNVDYLVSACRSILMQGADRISVGFTGEQRPALLEPCGSSGSGFKVLAAVSPVTRRAGRTEAA